MASLTSALGGAASGASAGTALLPGIGTVLGGIAGGLGGLFGGGDTPKAPDNVGYTGLNNEVSQVNQGMLTDMTNAWDPTKGTQQATDQVKGNSLFSDTYNQGMSQYGDTRATQGQQQGIMNQLQGQGYSLQPQDHEAYGQASGNIARQFGQQGTGIAQDLASRGLSAAPTGAAGAEFSGLAGNKNEMLAQAQKSIADARMNSTMQRIGQQQQFVGQLNGQAAGQNDSLGKQAQGALDSQRTGNQQGVRDYTGALTAASNAAQGEVKSAEFNAGQAGPTTGQSLSQAGSSVLGSAAGQGGLLGQAATGIKDIGTGIGSLFKKGDGMGSSPRGTGPA